MARIVRPGKGGRWLAGRLHQAIYGRTAEVYRRAPAEKVREIERARRGESVRDIAGRLGRAPGTVRRWLRGTQTPSARSQAQLDAELRQSLRDQRRGVVERVTERDPRTGAGNVRVKARTFIVGDARPRTRNWMLSFTPDQLDRLDDAAARGDDAAVVDVITDAIRDYLGGTRGGSGDIEEIEIEEVEIA